MKGRLTVTQASHKLAVLLLAVVALAGGAQAVVPADAPPAGEGAFTAAAPVTLEGAYMAHAPDALGLAYGGGRAFLLSLDAEALHVTRNVARTSYLVGPITGNEMYAHQWDAKQEEASFTAASLRATAAGPGATAFVDPSLARGYEVLVTPVQPTANAPATLNATGPRTLAPDEEGAREHRRYALRHTLADPHFTLSADAATLRVSGDFTLFIWDVDFTVQPEGAQPTEFQTGERDLASTRATARTEVANAIVRVTGGELVMRGANLTQVLASEVGVALEGAVVLPAAEGAYRAGSTEYIADGEDAHMAGRLALDFSRPGVDTAHVRVRGVLTGTSLAAAPAPGTVPFHETTGGRVTLGGGLLALFAVGTVLATRSRPLVPAAAAHVVQRSLRKRTSVEDAVAALERGDDAEAAALLSRLLAERPDDVGLLVDHGFALERLGRHREARDAFESAVRVAPGNGEAHYYYSRVLSRLGLTASALPHLQRALALDARFRDMARADPGFRDLRDHPLFVSLVGA